MDEEQGTSRQTTGGRGSRPRKARIEVWVTPQERELIVALAERVGLSQSGYLRAVGLNHPIRSIVDLDAVDVLAKVNGDLGRVAGLLKLWLSERRGEGARPADVEAMMVGFRTLQDQVFQIMGRIVHDR